MRIPSQFNDRSLYPTKDGRSGGNTSARQKWRSRAAAGKNDAYRRVFRLGIALVLVVVVMRQAAQPRIYQTFFGGGKDQWKSTESSTAYGGQNGGKVLVALAGQTPDFQNTTGTNESESAAVLGQENRLPLGTVLEILNVDPENAKFADQLVAKIDIPQQRLWVLRLARWNHRFRNSDSDLSPTAGEDIDLSSADSPTLESQIDELTDFDETLRTTWKDSLAEIVDDEFIAVDTKEDSAVVFTAFLKALDRAAMERVVDGTNWRSADSDAFYLQLDQADYLPIQGATVVGTLPLLQQPDAYRGQRVKVKGTIGLAEKAKAKSNGFGITDYWKLWVIPGDGGIRPIVLITRELPSSIGVGLDDEGKWKGDTAGGGTAEITAVGRFVKRLPYRSSIGADSAPVVIGRVIAQKTFAPPTSNRKADAANVQKWKLWSMLGGAVLAGLALAIWLTHRANKAAQDSRRLRANQQSHDSMNFSALADHPTETTEDLDTSQGDSTEED